MDSNNPQFFTAEEIQREQATFITKVYSWMAMALALTGFTAYAVASSEAMIQMIFGSMFVFYGLIIAELGLVWYISSRLHSMTANTATSLFVLYSVLNGLTMAFIFLVYTASSIASTFLITAGTFGAMSFYGYTTKKDLTSWGNILFMAVIGLIIASIVNIFLKSSMFNFIISCIGVLVFTGLTAYDTQKIKEMNIIGNDGTEEDRKEAISGALCLYLDFINLFLFLLRLLGGRRD